MTVKEAKARAAMVAAQINKDHKDEGLVVFGSAMLHTELPRVPSGSLAVDYALGGGWAANQWIEVVGEECLAPGTRILCADLRWRPIENLCVGDEIVGFDEDPAGRGKGAASQFQRAKVTALGRAVLPSYEIRTDSGTTVASAGHLWLVNRSGRRQWVRTDELLAGNTVAAIGPVWADDRSWEAGYLSGFYDGEGWVARNNGPESGGRVGVSQAVGATLDRLVLYLEKAGFTPVVSGRATQQEHWKDQKRVMLPGRYQDMRFLGSVRPGRLMEKADSVWEGMSTKQVHGSNFIIREVTPVGEQSVVTIGTSTKTLVADGMLSHNSHGKTGLILKTIAHNQALDPEYMVGWIAAEEFVVPYATLMGVDVDRVAVVDTNVMEEAYDAAVTFLDSRAFDCVVIDSLPALVPVSEGEDEMEDFHVGLGARMTNKFTRKARKATRRSAVNEDRPVIGFMVNGWREKIGVRYGDPRTTPGGKGKNYWYFQRVEVRRDEFIKDGEIPVGQAMIVRVMKNKTAPTGKKAHVDLYVSDYGEHKAGSFDLAKEIVDVGVLTGVVRKQGAWYRFGDLKLEGEAADPKTGEIKMRKGLPGLIAYVAQHPEIVEEIGKHVIAGTFPETTEVPDDDDDDDDEPPAKATKRVVKKKAAA